MSDKLIEFLIIHVDWKLFFQVIWQSEIIILNRCSYTTRFPSWQMAVACGEATYCVKPTSMDKQKKEQ